MSTTHYETRTSSILGLTLILLPIILGFSRNLKVLEDVHHIFEPIEFTGLWTPIYFGNDILQGRLRGGISGILVLPFWGMITSGLRRFNSPSSINKSRYQIWVAFLLLHLVPIYYFLSNPIATVAIALQCVAILLPITGRPSILKTWSGIGLMGVGYLIFYILTPFAA